MWKYIPHSGCLHWPKFSQFVRFFCFFFLGGASSEYSVASPPDLLGQHAPIASAKKMRCCLISSLLLRKACFSFLPPLPLLLSLLLSKCSALFSFSFSLSLFFFRFNIQILYFRFFKIPKKLQKTNSCLEAWVWIYLLKMREFRILYFLKKIWKILRFLFKKWLKLISNSYSIFLKSVKGAKFRKFFQNMYFWVWNLNIFIIKLLKKATKNCQN